MMPSADFEGVRVVGNTLMDARGPVRLLGVNHSGAEYACVKGLGFFDGPPADELAVAIRSWGANTVRLPLNEHCWLGSASGAFSGEGYRRALEDRVRTLRKHGLYVIVDLHWSAATGRAAMGQEAMADGANAPAFWGSVASRFRDDRGVLFDLFNEPFLTGPNAWTCWNHGCVGPQGDRVSGMQELIDAVRGEGATNVLLVGGLDYANDLRGWLAQGLRDPLGQLVASFHVYNFNRCRDEDCWEREIAPVERQVPVVAGELGENDCEHGFLDRFVRWADTRGVSYLGWTWNLWDCRSGPSLVTTWSGTPTLFGEGLRVHLLGRPR